MKPVLSYVGWEVLTEKFKNRTLESVEDDLNGGIRVRFDCGSSFHLVPGPDDIQISEFSDHGYITSPEVEVENEVIKLRERVEDLEDSLKDKMRAIEDLEEKLSVIRCFVREALFQVENRKDLEEALHE